MEPIFQQTFHINDAAVDCFGRLRPAMLLFYCQEVAGRHCLALGTDWDTLAKKRMFWAVIRQKVQITRLPCSGEDIRVETWPMPTTRTCYPRSTVAYDAQGNELFRAIGLWVLMDLDTRAMILPGKSGVDVQGTLTGSELTSPGSLAAKELKNHHHRQVVYSDLDRNGHMNNTRYLEWMGDLLPSAYHRDHQPREFTICYHSEARETDLLDIHWQMNSDDSFLVDAWREAPEAGNFHRIFTARVQY